MLHARPAARRPGRPAGRASGKSVPISANANDGAHSPPVSVLISATASAETGTDAYNRRRPLANLPAPFPAAIPAAYPFLRPRKSGKQQSVPISAAQHAEMGTLRHAADSAETGTVSPASTPPPSQKWVRRMHVSIRQAFGKQAFFPAETGTARGPAAPRHITPSPHSGAFSDESCDTAGPLPPRSRKQPPQQARRIGYGPNFPRIAKACACFRAIPILVGAQIGPSVSTTQILVRFVHTAPRPLPQKRVRSAR